MAQIHLGDGKWLLSDCGQMPSEKNCKLIMCAPEGQREDLIDAGVSHAVQHHGHTEDAKLREDIAGSIVDLD